MLRGKGNLLGLVLVYGVRGDHDPVVGLFELVLARRGSTLRLGWGYSHSVYGAYRFVCFVLFQMLARVKDFATFMARKPGSLPEVLSLLQGSLISPSRLDVTTACRVSLPWRTWILLPCRIASRFSLLCSCL